MSWPTSEFFQPYDEVTDNVSGWTGKITAEYRYANGCVRYDVSGADKDGKPEGFVFDHEQLTLVRAAVSDEQPAQTGGDRSSTPVKR